MKIILRSLLVFILILLVSFLAAPLFVRQEQVQNFIEKRIQLPNDAKLKLEGKIDFGFFPYAYIKVPKANLIGKDGKTKTFENFSFGFHPSSLLGKSISFDSAFLYDKVDYSGTFHIEDYNSFYKTLKSPVEFKLLKPLVASVKGDFKHEGDSYYLSNFIIEHESIKATGNVKVTDLSPTAQKIELDTVLGADNIDDFRKLAKFNQKDDGKEKLEGKGILKLNITAAGANADQFKSSLNGKGDLDVQDGAIYGIDMNQILSANSAAILGADLSKKIDIKSAHAVFGIVNGIVNVSSITANNQLADASGSGTVNLPANSLRFNMDIDAHTNILQAKVPLLVAGTFDNIKFTPRMADAIAGNLKNIQKINVKDVKMQIDPKHLKGSLQDIGKSFGINLGKKKGTVPPAVEPEAAPAAGTPESAQPQQPAQ